MNVKCCQFNSIVCVCVCVCARVVQPPRICRGVVCTALRRIFWSHNARTHLFVERGYKVLGPSFLSRGATYRHPRGDMLSEASWPCVVFAFCSLCSAVVLGLSVVRVCSVFIFFYADQL